ncbi:hypothetical protein B0A48_14773 [Cryoendolithus antarcticus]|uniref:BTB domain-containing protein n=1 Tax=Cryoendolithus antarcticus TaxID=1507870 RepID=A0A1V8SL81_9PEZI|nr:hypothetical protein B0A48_14773 [Cryoendolithus antarcticus]
MATTTGPRQKELHELLSRDMVDIYVGDENTHWTLHEKLLCHRSKFFRDVFYKKTGNKNQYYGLPDEDDGPFRLFVAWLYADNIPTPHEEKDLGPLMDLYLMGEKWEIKKLQVDVMDAVRRWYHDSDTLPSLRRVQYIYSNTTDDSPMRVLMVNCIARMLVFGEGMPTHWEKALRRNGQLAVDIILAVQKWKLDGESVPDAREEPVLPIVEEAEQKAEIKKEERDGENEEKHNGETSDYQTDAGQEQTEGEETETAIEEDE